MGFLSGSTQWYASRTSTRLYGIVSVNTVIRRSSSSENNMPIVLVGMLQERDHCSDASESRRGRFDGPYLRV